MSEYLGDDVYVFVEGSNVIEKFRNNSPMDSYGYRISVEKCSRYVIT